MEETFLDIDSLEKSALIEFMLALGVQGSNWLVGYIYWFVPTRTPTLHKKHIYIYIYIYIIWFHVHYGEGGRYTHTDPHNVTLSTICLCQFYVEVGG